MIEIYVSFPKSSAEKDVKTLGMYKHELFTKLFSFYIYKVQLDKPSYEKEISGNVTEVTPRFRTGDKILYCNSPKTIAGFTFFEQDNEIKIEYSFLAEENESETKIESSDMQLFRRNEILKK